MERIKPLFIVGPVGCGKTTYIKNLSKEHGRELLHVPCRKDRTLREQRSRIHEWAMRSEPSLLWLEGTDDLTPEAQSFLRRILETYSTNVLFCLEARTMESIQEPILSRCNIMRISQPTFNQLCAFGSKLGYSDDTIHIVINMIPEHMRTFRQVQHMLHIKTWYPTQWNHIMDVAGVDVVAGTGTGAGAATVDAMKSGKNPYTYIYNKMECLPEADQDIILRGLLQYSNPWAIYAYKRVCTPVR
jgi:hypothetical protein